MTPLGLTADPACASSRGATLLKRALGVGAAWARLWVAVCGSARGVFTVIFTFHQAPSPIFVFWAGRLFLAAGLIFVLLFVWKNSRWCPMQAAFRGMVGRQPSPHALPRPGHEHAAAVGGGGGPGHRLVVAHDRLCRGGWVRLKKRGPCVRDPGDGPCVVQMRAVASPAALPLGDFV